MFKAVRQPPISVFRGGWSALALWLALLLPGTASADGLRLVMVERPGCYYCIVFKRDVAPIYHRSEEGRLAPLVHADLRDPWPEDIELASRAHVTPTFVLVDSEGREFDRLTGYPGDDFFWPYINRMITRAIDAGADQAIP